MIPWYIVLLSIINYINKHSINNIINDHLLCAKDQLSLFQKKKYRLREVK